MDTVPDDPFPEKPSRAAATVPDEPAHDKPSPAAPTLVDEREEDKPVRKIDTVPDEPAPQKPRQRPRIFQIFVIIVLLFAMIVTIGFATHRTIIRDWIIKDARERGFVLDFADFTLQPDLVELSRVSVTMIGVPGIEARFETLRVHLQDLEPLKIEGEKSIVDVNGSPDELQQGLVEFAKTHQDSVQLPLMFDGEFRYGTGGKPIVLLNGNVESPGDGALAFGGTFQIWETKLGSLSMRRSKDNKVDVGLGLLLSDKPVVSVALDASAIPFKGSVTFASQKVDDVCRAFAMPIPKGFDGAFVEGSVSFVIDGALPSTPHHGTGAFVVNGWVPPHPRELDGIVFGKTTKLGAVFEVAPDLGAVRFIKASVDAGALHLEGKGTVVRDGLSARTKMDLAGNVPCTELGASAVGSRVRGFVGDLLQGVARKAMGGNVKVRVTVDADSKNLPAAKVDQAVEIGCRLRGSLGGLDVTIGGP